MLTGDQMILRVARAAARDHAAREPLTREVVGDDGATLADRLYWLRAARDSAYARWCPHTTRVVAEIVGDAEILGRASYFDPKYARHPDELVVRVRYSTTAMADYAVTPDPAIPASCWQD